MNPPDKLYKYRNLNAHTIDTIVRSVVYFAEPSSFNDPFDCGLRPANYKGTVEEYRELFSRLAKRYRPPEKVAEEVDQKIREGLHLNEQYLDNCWRDTQKQENEITGLFCLAKNPDNILMWSHYTDSHKGCCLEFSTVESIFKSARIVEYPPIYPNNRFLDCMNNHELLYKLTHFTKANLWEYEQEWRVLFDSKNEKGPALYKFEEKTLTGIIFGWNMTREHKELLARLVTGRNPSVQLSQAHPCKREFKMQIVPISAP